MLYKTIGQLTFGEMQNYTYEQLEWLSSYAEAEKDDVYLIEIFENDFTYRSSIQVGRPKLEIDYLDLVKNKIKVPIIDVETGDFIKITSKYTSISGIVTNHEDDRKKTTITFKDFMSLFDVKVLVDPTLLDTISFEYFLKGIIEDTFVNNSDTLQNITGLSVSVTSGTTGTIIDLDSNIVNLYDDIVYYAFITYNIVVNFNLDFQAKKVVCTIGKNSATTRVIEAELPNIIDKNIDLGIEKESTNKLIIVNEDDESEKIIYFLHTDDSISTTDENRIEPVIPETVYASASGTKTFADVALEKATATLTATKYNNLIELETTNGDDLVKTRDLAIGQNVSIINDGKSYTTVLTGKKIDDTTTLIFGAVRKELTKKLNRRILK